jgi:hypothetical protein
MLFETFVSGAVSMRVYNAIAAAEPPHLKETVLARVTAAYPAWGVRAVSLAAQGLECFVYRASTDTVGDIAIKVPKAAVHTNDNDPWLPARDLLAQEAACAEHLRRCGLPAPAVLASELRHAPAEDDPIPGFIVQQFVMHDDGVPDPQQLGQLAARIHRLPIPDITPVTQGSRPFEAVLAERIARRAAVVERISGQPLTLPRPDDLRRVLTRARRPRRLLHMDVRPANVLSLKGAVRAIVDWSNALLGDPYLEIGRIREYGLYSEAFRQAYDRAHRDAAAAAAPTCEHDIGPPSAVVDCIYSLDAAVMLAVVFLSEAPDPARGRVQLSRVRDLANQLARVW